MAHVTTTRPDAPDHLEPTVDDRAGTKATMAAGATVVLWASAFVVIRDVGHTLSPAPLALIRLAVGAAALTIIVAATRRSKRRAPRSWRSAGLVATFGVVWLAGYTVALNAGERHVDAGTAVLLVNLAPLMIAFGAGLFLGEGYPRALIVGSLVALGGVAIIARDSSTSGDWIGVVLCLLAAVLFTAGMLVQKVTLRHVDGLTATWLGCVAGAAVLTPWAPELVDQLRTASTGAIAGAVYLGLFPTAIGFVTWAYASHHIPTGRLSATTYAGPAITVVMSWLLLAETPTAYGLVGGAICLVGVAISRRRTRAAAPLAVGKS
jgi:drug/metabolite transporter (DMT)-like permease